MQESDIIEMLRNQHPNGADELISHYGPLMQYVIRPIVTNEQDRERHRRSSRSAVPHAIFQRGSSQA